MLFRARGVPPLPYCRFGMHTAIAILLPPLRDAAMWLSFRPSMGAAFTASHVTHPTRCFWRLFGRPQARKRYPQRVKMDPVASCWTRKGNMVPVGPQGLHEGGRPQWALWGPKGPRGAGAPPMSPMCPKGPRGVYGEAASGGESPRGGVRPWAESGPSADPSLGADFCQGAKIGI